MHYPCQVIVDVKAKHGYMEVSAGTQAKVVGVQVVDGQDQICIEIVREETEDDAHGQTGWVPKRSLEIGTCRRVGDIAFDLGDPDEPLFAGAYTSRNGLTYNTIKNLCLSYHENYERLPLAPFYVRDKLDTEARQGNFALLMVQGIDKVNKSLRPLLDSGNFDWKDLRDLCPDSSQLTDKVGIYLIVHENIRDTSHSLTDREPAIYSGSTSVSFQARYGQHNSKQGWEQEDPTSPHYRLAAKADNHYCFPICYLGTNHAARGDIKVAEQIIVDLFQTTCQAVLNLETFSETNEDTDGSAAAARQSMRTNEAQSRALRYHDDKAAAIVLARNAANVFAATGWPGGVMRQVQAERKPFGASAGLNWSMPITELQFEKTVWTMTGEAGVSADYRRVAYVSREDNKSSPGCRSFWGMNHGTQFYVPRDEDGPDFETKIHVVVSIRYDGQPCLIPWSRQPTVGPWSDSADATSVSIRIEWQNEQGGWVYKWLMPDYPNTLAKDAAKNDIPGATSGYRIASGLKAYFARQIRPITDDFPWRYDFGIAEIREVFFDFLAQTIRMRRVAESSIAPPVRALEHREIAQIMLNLGADTYAHRADPQAAEDFKGDTGFPVDARHYGMNRRSWSAKGPPRSSCDYCYTMVKRAGRSANQVNCREVGETRCCTQCTEHKKPCTFTRSDVLLANEALVRATISPAKEHKDVKALTAFRHSHSF